MILWLIARMLFCFISELVLTAPVLSFYSGGRRDKRPHFAWACNAHVTEGGGLHSRKIRYVAVGCRITPQNRPTVGRMRDLCGTTSLVHTGTFRSPGSAERGLPRNSSQGGGLNTRSPTLNLSQNTDTGDQRLLEVPPDNGLSMTPTLHILTSLCKTRGSLSSIRLLV